MKPLIYEIREARRIELLEIEKVEKEKAIQKLGEIYPYIDFRHDNQIAENTTFWFSMQKREDWNFNIFHNSPYVIFMMYTDQKLFVLNSGLKMPKFRQIKVKSFDHALEKIAEYGLKAKESIK